MAEHDALLRLATALGIATHWKDVQGREHAVPVQTLRALLRAMRHEARDESEAAARLQEWQQAAWRRPLPPVVVVREDEARGMTLLRLPSAEEDQECRLHLQREDGYRSQTRLIPGALELAESATCDGRPYSARRLALPAAPCGYHQLRLERAGRELAQLTLIVAPARCYLPETLGGDARVWGPALQLYAVRSERNWGIGDFTDLRHLIEQWAARGAALVGLNPLHALFLHAPDHASPYDSSSRLFINPLYIDPEAVADFGECEPARHAHASAECRQRLAALRASELVDYAGVEQVKLPVLSMLYAHFRAAHLGRRGERAVAFEAFRARRGRALRLFATFQALQEHLHAQDPQCWGWPAWPPELRDPDSPAVARLAGACHERIEFFEYLQWQAELQLATAAEAARAHGLGVGLYGDLAVAMNIGGADAWVQQDCLAAEVSVGAPPDAFNPTGQDWGLPPYDPQRLRAAAYAPFIAVLRACMRHFGALRIDHVMALTRLYWIPRGAGAAAGAYVGYPLEDLLGIVALESQRNACIVVGEDLGTVPDGLRQVLAAAGVLSYRLLYFESRPDGSFLPPEAYPAQALAAITTHDLPTLAGFWEGSDLVVRDELHLFPTRALRDRQVAWRAQARAQLLLALERAQLLPGSITVNPASVPAMTPELACALHRFLARSPARLLAMQIEDVLGATREVNVPGTTEATYPNWRRKLTLNLEQLAADPRVAQFCAAMNAERPARAAPRRGA